MLCASTCVGRFTLVARMRAPGHKASDKNRFDPGIAPVQSGSQWFFRCCVIVIVLMLFMRWVRNLADVQLRKQNENKRLDKSDEYAQCRQHHQDRKSKIGPWRGQARNGFEHLLVGKHVTEETYDQR